MNNFKLYFLRSKSTVSPPKPWTISVWPTNPGWNDFGYGFQAEASIKGKPDGAPFEFELFVVPWPLNEQKRFNVWLGALMGNNGSINVEGPLRVAFFTLMRDQHYYQDLLEWCDDNDLNSDDILRILRDLVFLRWRQEELDEVKRFLQTEAASVGIFRNESAYLAYHRAWRILARQNQQLITDSRIPFSFDCKLSGFDGAHNLNIKFNSPEPLNDRCHALIGRNGSGKTRLLRELVIRLGKIADSGSAEVFTDNGYSDAENDSISPVDLKFNRVLVMSWDAGSAFPSDARLDSPYEYLHFQMGRVDDEDANDAEVAESDFLTSMLVQLLREHNPVDGSGNKFNRLKGALNRIVDVDALAVFLTPGPENSKQYDGWVRIGVIRFESEQTKLELIGRINPARSPRLLGNDNYPIEMSSGERMFLKFAIRCIARMTDGSILILDEPETHLHPNLISMLMRILHKLLIQSKSVAVVATHSPFVVRELPSRCVHIVGRSENGEPYVRNAYLKTLGASVDRLSVDVFGDEDEAKHYDEIAKSIAKVVTNIDDLIERFGSELSSEMLSLVRIELDGDDAIN